MLALPKNSDYIECPKIKSCKMYNKFESDSTLAKRPTQTRNRGAKKSETSEHKIRSFRNN